MTNIILLKKDLQSPQSINDVLIKHNLSFKQCMMLLDNFAPKTHKYISAGEGKSGEKFIVKNTGKFYLRKSVDGRVQSFGGYNSLSDAVKVRYYLVENGWDKNRLNSICEELGVNGGNNS